MESIIDDIDTAGNGEAKIKVIGVGGGGGNAVQTMIESDLVGVQFICANTDMQALKKSNASIKIQLGEKLTRGLGAGAKPEVGREAAVESTNAIRDAIGKDTDLVFVTAGMGGGTGTGAAPVIAQIAKEMNALTVGVVTKPFSFEGTRKQRIAEAGLEEFRKHVDCLIIIPNDRLKALAPKNQSFAAMLHKANEVLLNAVRGISDVIVREGFINVDFADVKTTMTEMGLAIMGIGRATGENRAREAANAAILSPLLEDATMENAKAILYNITANSDITGDEIIVIGELIKEAAKDDINIIFGVVTDESMGDELQVTVIATGIDPIAAEEETEFPSEKIIQFDKSKETVSRPRTENAVREISPSVDTQNVRPVRRAAHAGMYGDSMTHQSDFSHSYGRRTGTYHPGHEDMIFEDDFEVPTWLRHNAD